MDYRESIVGGNDWNFWLQDIEETGWITATIEFRPQSYDAEWAEDFERKMLDICDELSLEFRLVSASSRVIRSCVDFGRTRTPHRRFRQLLDRMGINSLEAKPEPIVMVTDDEEDEDDESYDD